MPTSCLGLEQIVEHFDLYRRLTWSHTWIVPLPVHFSSLEGHFNRNSITLIRWTSSAFHKVVQWHLSSVVDKCTITCVKLHQDSVHQTLLKNEWMQIICVILLHSHFHTSPPCMDLHQIWHPCRVNNVITWRDRFLAIGFGLSIL